MRRSPILPVLLAALLGTAAHAQYKVVGPDGRVTYTDRAPTTSEGGRVTPLREKTAVAQPEVALPYELQQAASRYPVTLYVVTGACDPCAAARKMLRDRGVPYVEKTVTSAEDSEALQRLSGGREAPTLSIGTQVLRGFAGETWTSYIDAAGYPKESKLPPAWQPRPATPLVVRTTEAPASAARTAAAPLPARAATPLPAASGSIRF